MSEASLRSKVDFLLEMCENIANIVKRHGGITAALEDYERQILLKPNPVKRDMAKNYLPS